MTLPTIPAPSSPSFKNRTTTGPNPCYICNRDLKNPRLFIHIVDGGRAVFDPDETYDDEAADCGFHPIGPECLRQFPQLKPYAIKAESK